MGIMSISSAGGGEYTDAQARVLESVANLTAIALEKGKLYEETIRFSMEIQQRNKELDDFTYVVSHDLKEPLISVEGFSRILQSDYSQVIQPEGREYLDSIVSASTRMRGLIAELGQLLDDNDARWEAFGLNAPGTSEKPDPPEALVVTPGNAGTLLVDWADARRAARYRVFQQVLGTDADFVPAGTVTDSDATLTGLPTGRTVNVRVTAANEAGESQPSAEAQIVVP